MNRNTYNISDLAELVGTRPTWTKFLSSEESNKYFTKEVKENRVLYLTQLSIKGIKDAYEAFKKANLSTNARPKKIRNI